MSQVPSSPRGLGAVAATRYSWLGALAAEGVMHTRADRSVEVNAAGLPPSLALTALGRLSFLTSGVVEVLTLASVLGSSFSVADLSLVAGRPTGHLWGPLREAMAVGVLEERGERLAFRPT